MAGYNQMGGIPEGYDSILGAARQELVRLPDGTYVAAPKYGQATTVNDLYEGILGQGGVPPIGVQGTKRNRGSMPSADNSLGEPWPGAYDQTVMRNGSTRRDIIEDIPAPVMTAAAPKYSTLDTVTPLDINRLGLTTSPFKKPTPTPAERAIAEVIVRGGGIQPSGGSNRGHPTRGAAPIMVAPPPRLATADPWAAASGGDLRIGPSTQRPGYATGTPVMRGASAPAPAPVMRAAPFISRVTQAQLDGIYGSRNGMGGDMTHDNPRGLRADGRPSWYVDPSDRD